MSTQDLGNGSTPAARQHCLCIPNAAYSCPASESGAPEATSYHACVANPENVISAAARSVTLLLILLPVTLVIRPVGKDIPVATTALAVNTLNLGSQGTLTPLHFV
jgi:hypothetical protein